MKSGGEVEAGLLSSPCPVITSKGVVVCDNRCGAALPAFPLSDDSHDVIPLERPNQFSELVGALISYRERRAATTYRMRPGVLRPPEDPLIPTFSLWFKSPGVSCCRNDGTCPAISLIAIFLFVRCPPLRIRCILIQGESPFNMISSFLHLEHFRRRICIRHLLTNPRTCNIHRDPWVCGFGRLSFLLPVTARLLDT